MAITSLINSFNGGEFSPLVATRVQLEKYASGCRVLENFIPMTYGGVNRRPGTEYLGAAKLADRRCRLIGFNYSTTTRFVLELGHQYLRFWKDGVPVQSAGDPLEVAAPWSEDQLREVQYCQINDIMYLTHPLAPPQKLSRKADDDWTLEEVAWTWPAFLDENIEETTVSVSDTSGTTRGMTASADLFDPEHVGSYWQVAHLRGEAYVEIRLNTEDRSEPLRVLGDWEFTTYDIWDGVIRLQRCTTNSVIDEDWETIRTYTSEADRNVSTTGTEEKSVFLRIDYEKENNGGTKSRALLEAGDARVYGVVRITAVSDARHATVDVIKDLEANTATKIWAEGAWSDHRGYPRTVGLHEQRIIYGGTRHKPQMLWGSVVDDFENFRFSSLDDAAFAFALAATEGNAIQWIQSQDTLLIGTSGDEWTLGKADPNEPTTPSNIQARRQSSYGSKFLRSVLINDVTLFVQRQGRKVRELVYAFEKDGWVAPDLTILSEHVTRGEIVESAYQQQPDAIYWAVRGDGQLIGMTYERDQQVVGWHRHTTQGAFESVATIYGNGTEDEVWFCVRREIGGETHRYIERFKLGWREALEAEDKARWFYVDSGKTLSPESADVSGLEHLEGETVSVLADGAVEADKVVADGGISLSASAEIVAAGLPFISRLLPMRLEIDLADGSSFSRIKRVARLSVNLYKSLGGEFSTNGGEWYALYSRDTGDAMDDSPPVFTGEKEVYAGGDFSRDADVHIRQRQPLPLTLLTLTPRWDVTGD
jgi:hypothetical protein